MDLFPRRAVHLSLVISGIISSLLFLRNICIPFVIFCLDVIRGQTLRQLLARATSRKARSRYDAQYPEPHLVSGVPSSFGGDALWAQAIQQPNGPGGYRTRQVLRNSGNPEIISTPSI